MDTIIFGGNYHPEDLDRRIAEIKDRLKIEEVDAIAEKLKYRLAKLENKIAKFRIGGTTDTEKEELEFRIEDAIQASRAAVSSGVVPGGATTLLRLSQTDNLRPIFKKALENVFKQLMDNANLPADVKIKEVLESPEGYGINLRKGDEVIDLVKDGILDPTLVLEQVVKNASAAAAAMVSSDCVIVFEDKQEK
jgi:chaperonin GroEL